MQIQIKSARDIVSPWTHWFFYGPTGSGKTQAASMFPAPLFLVPSAEGSELTLAGRDVPYVKLGVDGDGNPVPVRAHLDAVLTDLEERHLRMRRAYAASEKAPNTEAADALIAEAETAFPWQTVVLESMTHLCAMLQDDIAGKQGKMDQQKWGIMSDFLRTVHTRLRAMDCHVIFTALAKIEGDDDATHEGAPDIPGKMARLLPSACDAIGFCETRDNGKAGAEYRVHFRQHRMYPARTRFKGVPAVVTNFTFAQVQAHLPK